MAVTTNEAQAGSPVDTGRIVGLLVRIALIEFVVETTIMLSFANWDFRATYVIEGLLDAGLLTMIASPLIYLIAVRPYARAADAAQRALKRELDVGRERALELQRALATSETLLTQNERLRYRLEEQAASFAAINERELQRIGADLHDGPAQLLSVALLRLNKLHVLEASTDLQAPKLEIARMQEALTEALKEVRHLSRGLQLPELAGLTLVQVVAHAISQHEDRFDSSVSFDIGDLPAEVPDALKVCIYRFLHEALANAYKHADAEEVRVAVACADARRLEIAVSDRGRGFDTAGIEGKGLGLHGLKARVQAIGGSFQLFSEPGHGTKLTARFELDRLARMAHAHGE